VAQFAFEDYDLTEFEAIRDVMQLLPQDSILHLANSMSVRYANYIGLETFGNNQPRARVFANRGTSGIDGSTSTAVGAALANPDQIVTLITGDLAFFYDRNAFWNNYLPKNLRVVLLNNHAGGIFRIINGAKDQPELAEYFETHQPLNAHNTAKDFKLAYHLIKDRETLKNELAQFFHESEQAKIVEIETNSSQNAAVLQAFKQGFTISDDFI
jgi:2-succinyl-5-enolpyruvyl-6-hydroxy-3-cyclohexene-1-carboxylate synthase